MKFLPIILFLSLALALPKAAADDDKHLKVGAVLALTGDASVHGNNILEGLKLAKADLELELPSLLERYKSSK